jgi:hypothetical protein
MRLGCLVLVLVAGAAAWLTRDQWMDKLPWRSSHAESSATTAPGWELISTAGKDRTMGALAEMALPKSRVYVTLSAGDIASYIAHYAAFDRQKAADSLMARVDGDQVRVRARVKKSELGGTVASIVGPLLRDREWVEMSGDIHVISKGFAEFRVRELKVRGIGLPDAAITRLVRSITRITRPPGASDAGLPLPIPPYIADVRVLNGKITLYKTVK